MNGLYFTPSPSIEGDTWAPTEELLLPQRGWKTTSKWRGCHICIVGKLPPADFMNIVCMQASHLHHHPAVLECFQQRCGREGVLRMYMNPTILALSFIGPFRLSVRPSIWLAACLFPFDSADGLTFKRPMAFAIGIVCLEKHMTAIMLIQLIQSIF